MTNEATGWHFHWTWRNEAWPDGDCPDPRTAIPLPPTDERVIRAQGYYAEEQQ